MLVAFIGIWPTVFVIFWVLISVGELLMTPIYHQTICKIYILATSDFAKGMQTDINHYMTRDRINNACFRQKLDPIDKKIFEDRTPWSLFLRIFLPLIQKIQ